MKVWIQQRHFFPKASLSISFAINFATMFLPKPYWCFSDVDTNTETYETNSQRFLNYSNQTVSCVLLRGAVPSSRITCSLLQTLATIVKEHLDENVSCSCQFKLCCPMCANPVCADMKRYLSGSQGVLTGLRVKRERLGAREGWRDIVTREGWRDNDANNS